MFRQSIRSALFAYGALTQCMSVKNLVQEAVSGLHSSCEREVVHCAESWYTWCVRTVIVTVTRHVSQGFAHCRFGSLVSVDIRVHATYLHHVYDICGFHSRPLPWLQDTNPYCSAWRWS